MSLIDHSFTRVLLIGASEFPRDTGIRPIPNVVANLQLLKDCLIDPEIVGIPEENITLLLNENKLVIERHLHRLVKETRNKDYTLLIYYSGHGMLSNTEYGLYLTTADTQSDELEIDGISIDNFNRYFKRSNAGIKIAILDCCHSGAIFNTMGDMPSIIQANIKGFEGTYIMTSAAEDKPALFPAGDPKLPTYFTGKFIEVIRSGVEGASEYCSLRDIYDQIDSYCREHNNPPLPRPQQGNFLNADQLYFSRNKKFKPAIAADVAAWEQAQKKNDKWGYVDFRESFPDSIYIKEANRRINLLEEEEEWSKAVTRNTVSSYYYYIDNYPDGKFAAEALNKVRLLRPTAAGIPKANEAKERLAKLQTAPNRSEVVKTTPDQTGSGNSNKHVFYLILTILGVALFVFILVNLQGNTNKNLTSTDSTKQMADDSSRMQMDSSATVLALPNVPSGARVFFANLKNGQVVSSPLKVEMGVEGMKVDTAGTIQAASGHFHLLIDAGDSIPSDEVVPKDSTHLHFGKAQTRAQVALLPGKHVLTLQFSDGIHRSYGSQMAATITVTVPMKK